MSLIQAEIYVDEYIGDYWVMKYFFDHPDYTTYMEREVEQSEIVSAGQKLLAAEEAAKLEQEKAEAEQREAEAARAAHKVKFGEWEHELDQDLGNIIFVDNISSESEYDTWLRLTYTCDGKLLLSDEELFAQRIRMRFDDEEINRRWDEHSWLPGTIQLRRAQDPALHGNRLSVRLKYKSGHLLTEGKEITDVATFPIARWNVSVHEYCS